MDNLLELAELGEIMKELMFLNEPYKMSTSHRSFSPERVLEMSDKWKAHPLPKHPIRLFVGILSATNHFAERMAIRKTWMQSSPIKSSDVVVRFFVALNPRKEVNAMLKKEASYFGDVVILPFMDRYELVVLKTIAICEFGVRNVTAAHVMKCDDDTFVRVDAVLKEIEVFQQTSPYTWETLISCIGHSEVENGQSLTRSGKRIYTLHMRMGLDM